MTPEQRERLAGGLLKNALLPKLLDEFSDDLREQWEQTQPGEAEARELVYLKLKTLDDLRDSIYARLTEYAGDGGK